ncbi:MAG: type II and III secretion system protein [Planctomycetes bacterium]|nr:type II and III secretion system protein [Planctomycetota bacterium]
MPQERTPPPLKESLVLSANALTRPAEKVAPADPDSGSEVVAPETRRQDPGPQDESLGWNPRLPAVFATQRGRSLIQRFGPRLQFLPDGRIRRFLHVPVGMGNRLEGLIKNEWFTAEFAEGNPEGNLVQVQPAADKAIIRVPGASQAPSPKDKPADVADWLLITAREPLQDRVDRWLNVWWTGREHVEIRVLVIERELREIEDFGSLTRLSPVSGRKFIREIGSELPNQGGGSFLDLRGIQDAVQLESTLQLLQRLGHATITSVPTVVARDGIPAQVTNVTRIPYLTATKVDPNGNVNTKIDWENVGVQMDVTAMTLGRDQVDLTLDISVTSINAAVQNPDLPAPTVATTLAQTNVKLTDGQSLLIGGLKSTLVTESVESIPLLGDIPILGVLFRSIYNENRETEVIFIVTPTIRRLAGARPQMGETGGVDALFDDLGEEGR